MTSRVLRWLAVTATAITLSTGTAVAAQAADNPYERGPAPTLAALQASRGPYAVSTTSVSRLVATGFGGGEIYYPTSTADGTFGAIAISPGFTAYWSSISWLGPRLASHGFVVIGIETLTTADQPDSRGDQLLAALDYLTQRSSVRTRIDSSRLAVAGHSMGGGGSLEAAGDRPSLQAAVPLAPWNLDKSWTELRVPTLIVGGESDTIAPVSSHSIPFYTSIPAAAEKSYLELNNASHFFPQTTNTPTAVQAVSWLKRFVDNDTRYDQFICPGPSSTSISDYRSSCPLS
ncbi:lipase [Actinoplanes sichuanensis]|uniref:Alpha/beta hydrolase family protein n=1 Tax=Actinoplanes sichuanensis TaxID=512349 RepID=A0ABW4AFE5_9ACTN|nr:alpha/beta hydrolase [Actinoplanes sichuanensis]BEL02587.1 lipase [Actinoplanes sichuanensis]